MDAGQIAGTVIGAAAVAGLAVTAIESVIRRRLRFPRLVTEKTCFLVSDREWQAVLGLVPVAYWSRPIFGWWFASFFAWIFMHVFGLYIDIYTHLRKNPVLIFHEEGDGAIDADSIIYFFQQFDPDRVYLVGDTPPELDALLVAPGPVGAYLPADIIYRIYPQDYREFWPSIREAVIVGRTNYRCALMASAFASLESIPIFFLDSSNLDDYKYLIDERKIYVVGELDAEVADFIDANASGRVDYTLDELVEKYIFQTRTRKIIMVNPDDLGISISPTWVYPFRPDRSVENIWELYSRSSLAAPVLAAGRYEIIIYPNVAEPEYTDYDQLIENYILQGKIDGKYLTIIGSPTAIPQSIPDEFGLGLRLELDGRYYGSVREDLHYVDLATGRIYGVTPSDVSGNIARSLFYDYLPRSREALVLPRQDYQDGIEVSFDGDDLEDFYRAHYWTERIESEFDETHFYSGYREIADNFDDIQRLYNGMHLIMFADHGTTVGFAGVISTLTFIDYFTYLMNPVVIDLACETGQYDKIPHDHKPLLFVAQSIRRGAIVQLAAVCDSYWHQMFDEILNGVYLEKKSLGEAYRIAKNSEYDRNPDNYHPTYIGDPWYFLMGDPAFVPKYW